MFEVMCFIPLQFLDDRSTSASFQALPLPGEAVLLLQRLDECNVSLLRVLRADLLVDELLPGGTLGFLLLTIPLASLLVTFIFVQACNCYRMPLYVYLPLYQHD